MGPNALFSVTVDIVNNTIRIAPRGDLDMSTVPGFEYVIRACEQEPASTIMLDLRNVTSLHSTGIRVLRDAWNRSVGNRHRLLFVEASTSVRKVFEVMGIGPVLDGHKATVSPINSFTRAWSLTDPPADPGDLRA
jgi:anti-anti-sigma factor